MREIRSPLDGIISPFASRRFTPSLLFRANEPGYVYDLNDMATLFQDTAGTQPVTAAGQGVARRNDKSGRGNHATQSDPAKRPLYALLPANGLRNLANGSADVGNPLVWGASFTNAGITVTKIANGFDTDGLSYVDWQVSGTASATSGLSIYSIGLSRHAASIGQQFTCSFIARLIAGSVPAVGNGLRPEIIGETAPSTVTEFFGGTLTVPITETVMSVSGTLANGATNQVRGAPAIGFVSGAVLNFTVRIKALQFELGAARTAYQFNYAATNVSQLPFSQVGALLYDGVDDFMVTPAIDFSGTDKMFLCHGVRKTSEVVPGMVVALGIAGATGTFYLLAPRYALGSDYEWSSKGTLGGFAPSAAAFPAPDTAVIGASGDISGDRAILRRNGSQLSQSTGDQGTGNYANAPVYFGANGGTASFFKGYEFSSICRGGAIPPAAQIVGAEGWVRARTAGAY